jgi:hypothetical protein
MNNKDKESCRLLFTVRGPDDANARSVQLQQLAGKVECLRRSSAAVIEGTFCRVEYNSDRVAIKVPPEFNLKP